MYSKYWFLWYVVKNLWQKEQILWFLFIDLNFLFCFVIFQMEILHLLTLIEFQAYYKTLKHLLMLF